MKKAVISLILALVPIILLADPVEIDGIYYNLIEKGKIAEVTKNPNNYAGSVIIPESVSFEGTDYNVTTIGAHAFNSSLVTSITIPESVTVIGECAFAESRGLTNISIPNSVTKIENSTFLNCTSLTSVTLPNNITDIGDWLFSFCTGLTSITIPNGVISIGREAFYNCTSLTDITIPNSVTTIEANAFTACSSLTSITIPNSVWKICERAFAGCTGLTSIIIPNSVTKIENSTFLNCTSLTSVTLPNNITDIGDWLFSFCTGLTSITIPNGVISIGREAFQGCTGLNSITIPESVTNLSTLTFSDCPNLNDVYCYAEEVPYTIYDAFEHSYIEYATLHVPESAINKYKETEPWKNFGKIVALDGATTQKCETPTISYENGELKMACATEGVEYVTDIADSDIKKHYSSEITLSATYNISVYATKAGFENSDVVNATLCWIDSTPKTEGITNGVTNVNARAVLIQNNGGIITVNGVDDGMRVSAYSLSGVEEASAISRNGAAVLNTNAHTGSTVIVKMGEKSVKVLMK